MTNAPAKTGTTAATVVSALLGVSSQVAAQEAGVAIYSWAKFDAKKGMFSWGQGGENIIPARTKVYINLASMRVGATCWVQDKAVDSIEESYWAAKGMLKPENMEKLPDHGPYKQTANGMDGWRGYYNLQFITLDTKAEFVCAFSSGGSQRAVKDFVGEVIKAHAAGIDIDHKTPVVTLTTKMIKTNAGHNVTSPVLTIEGWVDNDTVTFSTFTGRNNQKKVADGDVIESKDADVTI